MSPQGEDGGPADSTTTRTTTSEAMAMPAGAAGTAATSASDSPSSHQDEGGGPTQTVHRGPHPDIHDQGDKTKKKKKKRKDRKLQNESEDQQQQDTDSHASSRPTTPINMTPPRSSHARSPFGAGSPYEHTLTPSNIDITVLEGLASGVGSNNGGPSRDNTPSRSPSRRSRHARRAKIAATTKKRKILGSFILGAIFGMSILGWVLRHKYPQYVPSLSPNLNLNISAVLPAGFGLGLSAGELNSTILTDIYGYMSWASTPETYPGLQAAEKNYSAKYSIVLIPGFVTTGLEVWQGEECASSLFRSRLWGAVSMLQTMLMKPECWTKHMALDMETGLDPPNIRIRAAQGLEAADFFMPGFWVWARLIRDFAAIGYDHSNLALQSYDWRLSLHDLERRDHYFTQLMWKIEGLVKINKEKVVLVAHSYGSNVIVYFFAWVESPKGGNRGKKWCETHIKTFVNIAGPLLGVVKSASAYVSGEMHDTAELGPLEGILFGKSNNAFHRTNRRRLFRSWGSLTAMLPKGGNQLWGNLTHAPEDLEWDVVVSGVGGMEGEMEETCLPHLEKETGTFSSEEMEGKKREGTRDGEPAAAAATEAATGADGITREEGARGEGGEEACITHGEARRHPLHHGQILEFTPLTPLVADADAAHAAAAPPDTPPPRLSDTTSRPSKSTNGSVEGDHQTAKSAEEAAAATQPAAQVEKDDAASAGITASLPPSNRTCKEGKEGGPGQARVNWTMDDVIRYLSTDPEDPYLRRRMTEDYYFGPPVRDFRREKHVKDDRKYWTNPLTVQLPMAPSMQIVCFYGVGKATERAYIYKGDTEGRPDVMDISVSDALRNISGGVVKAEGDGTVTLMSLGFHCARLWRERVHNPAGIGVTTKELWHTTGGLLSMRGDGGSADHVDIMGNTKMAADLLKIVSGQDEEEVYGQDVYFSRIREISDKVSL
ncbi:phospholipid:diacylglycerol acyltransferase [Nannochloropsis oceanica]